MLMPLIATELSNAHKLRVRSIPFPQVFNCKCVPSPTEKKPLFIHYYTYSFGYWVIRKDVYEEECDKEKFKLVSPPAFFLIDDIHSLHKTASHKFQKMW